MTPILSCCKAHLTLLTLIQDIVHYMRTNFACSRAVRGVILQVFFPVMSYLYNPILQFIDEFVNLKMLSILWILKYENHVVLVKYHVQ